MEVMRDYLIATSIATSFDRSFDVEEFLSGAKSAYKLVIELVGQRRFDELDTLAGSNM